MTCSFIVLSNNWFVLFLFLWFVLKEQSLFTCINALSIQPSHSDKATNPEVLRWVNELARLRKQLKGKTRTWEAFLNATVGGPRCNNAKTVPVCSTRTQVDEVWRGPAASDPSAQQHTSQKLRLSAGKEASAGEGAKATGGEHPGINFKETPGEEGGGEPARGYQGITTSVVHIHKHDCLNVSTEQMLDVKQSMNSPPYRTVCARAEREDLTCLAALNELRSPMKCVDSLPASLLAGYDAGANRSWESGPAESSSLLWEHTRPTSKSSSTNTKTRELNYPTWLWPIVPVWIISQWIMPAVRVCVFVCASS